MRMPITAVLRRLRQEAHCKFKASLAHVVTFYIVTFRPVQTLSHKTKIRENSS